MTELWTVVVPLKPAAHGKSRLAGAPIELVRAIGLDTVHAAATAELVARVIVVTADAATAAALDPGVTVVADPGDGLNAAIAAGAAASANGGPVAALLGDLPALRPRELDEALAAAAAYERAVVPDAEGTGSTLVTAVGVSWACAFGAGSFARHLDLGCVPLALDAASGIRRDVDTMAQLGEVSARAGRRTRAAWAVAGHS